MPNCHWVAPDDIDTVRVDDIDPRSEVQGESVQDLCSTVMTDHNVKELIYSIPITMSKERAAAAGGVRKDKKV